MRARVWEVYLGSVAAAMAAYIALPAGVASEVAYNALIASAVVAILAGVVRQRLRPRTPWLLLAAAISCFLAGDLIWARYFLTGVEPFPSIADVFYLAGYPAMCASLVLIVRTRTSRRDLASLIDAAIVAAVGAVLAWHYLLAPYATDSTIGTSEQFFAMAYPAMDLALLAVAVRLFLTTERSVPAIHLLGAGLLALLVADTAFGILQLNGSYVEGSVTDLGWIASVALIGAAALHPSAPLLVNPVETSELSMRTARVVAICLTWLVVPAALLTLPNTSLIVAAVASIVVFGLVLARMIALTRLAAQTAAARGEQRLAALVRNSRDAILVLDSGKRISYASPAALPLFGELPEGRAIATLVHPDDRERFDDEVRHVAASPLNTTRAIPVRVVRVSGAERVVEAIAVNLADEPSVAGVVLTIRDITDREVLEAELRYRAFHDALTGLANRELLYERLAAELTRAQAGQPLEIAVLLIDLDDFKAVNDGLGHHVGDTLLHHIAAGINSQIRSADTAARLGGDEFAVLLTDVCDIGTAMTVANRFIEALSKPLRVAGLDLKVGASIGVAIGRPDSTPDSLLQEADLALYGAKDAGKGQARLFDVPMHARAVRTLQLKADLTAAIEREELSCAYQPIVDLATGAVVGGEALARWHHPGRGAIAPMEFIPAAEENGQIEALGRLILTTACRDTVRWLSETPVDPFVISVNVSTAQLRSRALVDAVCDALDESGLPARRLQLELTESLMMADPHTTMTVLRELSRLGVHIAIDDFGTGYSSLAYIQRLPVDVVKIDRTFLASLDRSDRDAVVMQSILGIASSLGIETVAEGIEDDAHIERLRALSCRYGQGFRLAPPLPADEFCAVLRSGVPLTSPV